jgi:hypothetical protein
LIYPDYASSASTQVVQHRLGDFEAHAEALQPRREGPAQVMQPLAAPTPEAAIFLVSGLIEDVLTRPPSKRANNISRR